MSEKDREQAEQQKDISRRQFLNYALMGTGGFLAAMPLVPMLRFAVDPALQKAAEEESMKAVGNVADFTTTPKRVDFTLHLIDGWYETEQSLVAYVYKNENDEIVALSNTCTHLGCAVKWAGSEAHPDQFHCPCHGGRYTKDGINIEGTPPTAPLAVYQQKIEGGKLYLGRPVPRTGKEA